ncbi:MAG: CARDB domain-containing protein [Candidatus Poseidoniales archaeon]
MSQKIKSVSLVSIMLLSVLSTLFLATLTATANTVVITEAIRIVDGGTAADTQTAIGSDSEGNVHIVWARNNLHLYYSMLSPRGETLIDTTQITNPGLHKIWHPDMVVDENDKVHVVWADKSGQHKIVYTVLNPWAAAMDGSASDDGTLSAINDHVVSSRAQNRDWPAIDIDSQGGVHIAWEDSYDELGRFFNQPQIYYTMLNPDISSGSVITNFEDTLLTPIIGHKGHPDIVVDANDYVQIAWDDTRGGKVELSFIVDTSGSMYSEWADICTVVYGGNFASGGYFQGIKPMLETANMTVYETIYGLGNTLPGAASSGNCAGYNQNAGPRTTALGQFPGDDSGGIRKLPGTVYNGNTYSGYSGEDWGPGTNWACLSWKDATGNVPGNPPTQDDHRWNPNATKIVIPVSDEGPKDGDPSQQADDLTSIEEAHDNCILAGVVPVGLYGQGYGGAGNIQSHFMDLAQCPNSVVSTSTRNCPGNTLRSSDAGGQAYEFPSGSGGSNAMALLVEAMVYISTNNSREIYMTVLDPYGKMNNDPSWVPGATGHSIIGGSYAEDTGAGADGHLVVVNDTRVTIDDAYSFHPSIGVDMQGNTHIAWMDGRNYGFEKGVNYEVYYTKLRLQGAGAWDGANEGLSTYAIKKIQDTPISNVETNSGLPGNRPYGGNSVFPALLTDDQNNIHIAWVDSGNATADEEILYTRLNSTDLTGPGLTALDPWDTVAVTSWASNKLGPNSGSQPSLGMPPAFYNDLGSGAHIAWSDTNKCSEEANNNRFTICYSHVLTGQVDVEFQDGETFYHVIEPGEQTIYNMSMNNSTPGPKDLVADTFGLNISGVPQNWTATLFFADNHTTIMPDTAIFLEGGEDIRFYIRIRAPSVYQADADQLADITVTAKSYKDPAIQSDIITRTLMDVVHGINLDTSHSMADVEQGQTAIFSITITNTGNVNDRFIFWDPYTLEGQQEWLLPFNWAVVFPTSVELDPGQSVTKNLEVLVPTSEDPGAFVIYLKGWSEGEPIKSIEKGTYDVLELGVFVSIRSTGNIVMEIFDTSEYVDPGKCATYPIDVTKNFDSGSLVFVTPGAPDVKPDTISMDAWRTDNWVLNLDFSNAPGGNSIEMSEPRAWTLPPGAESVTYEVSVEVCAPTGASAGLGPAVILKAYLEGYPRISASKILSTNVNHVYQLHADVDLDEDDKITLNGQEVLPVNPGQQISLSTTVTNLGNGPDRFDYRLARVTDPTGVDVIWDIDVPRETLKELSRDTDQIFEITMNVPDQVEAGVYMVVFQTFSEESYPDSSGRLTRLRATLELPVYVQEFYDMQISMDSTVDNAIKTSAPGRIVRFELNITNNGNVPDWPTLNNHTANRDGEALIWTELPGMGTLGGWSVEWRLVKQIGTDLTTEEMCETVASLDVTTGDEDAAIDPATAFADLSERCVYLESDDRYFMPMMDPYTTYPVVAIVKIAPTAKLDTRSIGLKVVSKMGNMLEGGDHDDSPSWAAENLDTNEFVVTLRLRAPNLVISEVTASDFSGDVDTTIPIRVVLQNDGNTHATDIEIVLCEYPDSDDDTLAEIRLNGCDDENIVMRHMIGALLAPDASEDYKEIELVLLYPVSAGSHGVYVVVDPSNSIVETNEKDNIMGVEDELKSSGGVLDVASEVIGKTALPFAVILLTLALFGVVYLVGRGRRQDVLDRKAEQSSLVSVLAGNDL